MVRVFPLDMIIVQGETYFTGKREYFVVKKVGTNASSDIKLVVDNKPVLVINSLVAPLHRSSSNVLGPVSLGNYYIAIPPETKFVVEGEAGAKVRLIGVQGVLAPGEPVPSDVSARFANQHNAYVVHLSGSVSMAVDAKLPADAELEIFSLTPKTIEKYVLSYPVMGKVDNYTPAEGDLAYRFYIDNAPLDVLTAIPGKVRGGVDILAIPRPPTDAAEKDPFSFAEMPLEVAGDHTLSVRVRNTKGADIAPAAGTALRFYFDTLAVYIKSG